MVKIVIESGADMPKELVEEYGISVVPMHLSMGGVTYDDGAVKASDVCAYYDKTKKLPTSSGCTPADFMDAFESIHKKYPDAYILYVAYSSATTCSFQSAAIAADGLDYVTLFDSQFISAGQSLVALKAAKMLKDNPDTPVGELLSAMKDIREKVWMGCIPDTLDYLQAGGRVSNRAALCGKLLAIHPLIEIVNGTLVATQKLRGSMKSVIPKFLQNSFLHKNFNKEHIFLIEGPGLSSEIKVMVEKIVKEHGFKGFTWFSTGSVITVHGGPRAFAIAGVLV